MTNPVKMKCHEFSLFDILIFIFESNDHLNAANIGYSFMIKIWSFRQISTLKKVNVLL